MESGFGFDFSQVRIHTDEKAISSVKEENALAYTAGKHVVFGKSQYHPQTASGKLLIAHELSHVVQQDLFPSNRQTARLNTSSDASEREADSASQKVLNGGKAAITEKGHGIQFYGHDKSCDTKKHLENHIWQGHDHARKIVDRATSELNKTPLHPTVISELERLFDASDKNSVQTIKANFSRIRQALDEDYLYKCADPCKSPYKGARAWADKSSTNKDITLCFDQIKNFKVPATAWIITHENVHRGLNVWPNPHLWDATSFSNCTGSTGRSPSKGTKGLLSNPDSYACFASRMWFQL